ncbi:MAG: hypothetical protein HC923_00650 [Myxococcales bacterium]|nr:hypothetical protein [Myxococcales bacterium]
MREIVNVNYPFFADVRGLGISSESPVGAGLPALTVPFASPVTTSFPEGAERTATVLLQSSPDAWTTTNTNVQPDVQRYGELGFAAGDERKAHPLAVLVNGTFESAFADQNPPSGEETVIKQSPPNTRLAVIGSTSMVNDLVLQLSRQGPSNLLLTQNLIDWGVEDTDLLSIRARSTFARTLVPMTSAERARYEYLNYGLALAGLVVIFLLTVQWRRQRRPIVLEEASSVAPGRLAKEVQS